MATVEQNRARSQWRPILASAFRTSLACTLVAGATLYGPDFITSEVAFPAFSYATVILIMTDVTLGHSLRSCWLAAIATVQGVCPAVVSLRLIGPGRLTTESTVFAVAVSAFFVALPGNTHLVSKRIALGQIVLVYVVGFINGERTDAVMHPVHVAASTAVGVVACVLALLFPYPSLAFFEVKENYRLYIENASERLSLFIKSFSAEETALHNALVSQAKSLNITGRKYLGGIQSKQESMHWETLPIRPFKSFDTKTGKKLQDLETVLNGVEIAMENCSEMSQIRNDLVIEEMPLLNQFKNTAFENTTLSESETERNSTEFLKPLQIINSPITMKDLPSLFFIFTLRLLQPKETVNSSNVSAKQAPSNESQEIQDKCFKYLWNFSPITIDKGRLMPALKCSLSLGFAVLFGLIYSKEDSYWAGLPVAISLASAREATFRVANVKAQGTVLGSVYGIIGCFIFEHYVNIRFVSLIPWFVFCTFLRQSKMYGQAGGITAVIGALLLLGRRNFGSPSDFAIARIVETYIGLSCSIMVDILLQPTRASVLAKLELSKSLQTLHESVRWMSISSYSKLEFEGSQNKLQVHVNELGKLIEEAELEPNFWFLPFHSGCYTKLKLSLSKTVDLLLFANQALTFLEQESRKMESKIWKEACIRLESDFKVLRDSVCSGIKCFQEVSLVKSASMLENEYEKRKDSLDLEMGKCANGWSQLDIEDKTEKSTGAFLQHLQEAVSSVDIYQELKMELILNLSAIVFCMNGLVKETKEIENAMKELVQWENPSSQVDLNGISYKLQALAKNVQFQ